ncbi:hypothetical protein FACS18948_6800 [Clostridia bacterium]|nr:hypothetical protein FACS18948_6800 [Clostridia bacterium]
MSRMKMLYNLVTELRQLALQTDRVAESLSEAASLTEDEAIEEAAVDQPTVTLEQVRAVLADKGMKGHNAQVRALLEKHGAKKLSDIHPMHYAQLLVEAEAIK